MDLPIKSINDLKDEIYRLKNVEQQQGVALAARFSSPSAVFSTLYSMFPKSAEGEHAKGGFFNQDIVGLLSRIVLPFTLNKTIFRNSNFIIKALVGLVSQKASHFISEDSVSGVWDKVKSWLPGNAKHDDASHAAHVKQKPEKIRHKPTAAAAKP